MNTEAEIIQLKDRIYKLEHEDDLPINCIDATVFEEECRKKWGQKHRGPFIVYDKDGIRHYIRP
jgi:hypothetical protein